jgi:NAD(P)H-hydrate repair Nnr-like enzyme with NAD(P)H-hydrate dehydratase domain
LFGCTVILKGSGTVIAEPGQIPVLNATGNARLATAGTGDVLAGMVGAHLAGGQSAFAAACAAAYEHGAIADAWQNPKRLTASQLALGPVRATS